MEIRRVCKSFLLVMVVIVAFSLPVSAQEEGKQTLFTNVNVFDGKSERLATGMEVLVEGNLIKQIGTWKLSQAVETGLGQIELSSECAVDVIHEAPGFVTDLFTVRDPVQNRRLMGVARLDLVKKNMDYFTVGPAQQVTFALGPNRLQAYGLLREINHYEFWGFDLANRRLRDWKEFPGRPRMKVKTSSNGKLLYIYEADDAIHIYNAASYEYLRTIHLDAYHRTALYVIPPK